MVFRVFHGKGRSDAAPPPHESPAVVTIPLGLLAIPSVAAGWVVGDVVYGDFFKDTMPPEEGEFHGRIAFMAHGFHAHPYWPAGARRLTTPHPYSTAIACAQRRVL